jgi:hypothetical protein
MFSGCTNLSSVNLSGLAFKSLSSSYYQAMLSNCTSLGNNSILVANNNEEAALGRFNEANENTRFSIGIGKSEDDRKNAFEVKQNGDIYIEGIGGYDGIDTTTAKSVQEVINELVNKLNEIK